jgi:hypothetical protein
LEDIYLLQIKDPHFQNCTYGYQISLIQSTACFILACRKRVNYFPSDYPKTNADKELIRLNDLLNIQIKKIGVGVYFENIMGDLVVKINTKKGVLNGKCDKNYQN